MALRFTKRWRLACAGLGWWALTALAQSAVPSAPVEPMASAPVAAAAACLQLGPVYVLGDSIAFGQARDRLALRLRKLYGNAVKINFDSGRSITEPGLQIKRSALQAIEDDRAFIEQAQIIVLILGTNQTERSFANSQLVLLSQLKALAPQAHYFWVDIGATLASQAQDWSARNQIIYANAAHYGYTVISRYRAIFGPEADPLAITPGRNFPGMLTESGFGSEGNVHGADPQLGEALLQAFADLAQAKPACVKPAARPGA